MPIPKYLEEHVDHIDAAMFTGDTFHAPDARAWLRGMMIRWERGVAGIAKPEEPKQTCPDCGKPLEIDTSPGACENAYCVRA